MRRSRLRRLDEVYEQHPLFFVTFCTDHRKQVLNHAVLHEAFRSFCLASRLHENFVGRYVIMPDHVHLFVRFHSPESLSMWMKSLKNALSKTLRSLGHPAPHWQKDFFDHILRSEESFASKWEYVEQNPVRMGLVARSGDWPYQGEINEIHGH